MTAPVDPWDIKTLETIYTDAWRDEQSTRTERARAGIRAVAEAVRPKGWRLVPDDAPDDGAHDITVDARERRQKRGW